MAYSLGVRLSSTAAVTKRIEGNLSNIVLIPFLEARIFTKMIFSSGTPFALIVSIAEHAEPPVANMGSRMITPITISVCPFQDFFNKQTF